MPNTDHAHRFPFIILDTTSNVRNNQYLYYTEYSMNVELHYSFLFVYSISGLALCNGITMQ